MIEVVGLKKKYGNHMAVDGLDFSIDEGKIYGFLGPNGAGKSTTMNMLTGYLAPTSGKIVINGVDMKENPEEAKKNIGYLPEIPPVYPDMTVDEYVSFVAELKKVPKEERKKQIEEIKELTQINDVSRKLIRNLSKGYRQRVGLAQAIIGYPKVIILDEPMVGLDPKQIIEIRDLIKELGKSHTIILSSHILSEISAVCDHILIISKGKLVAMDTPQNLQAGRGAKSSINLCVKADEATCLQVLSPLEDVTIDASYDEETKTTALTIETSSEEDIREKIFFMFAGASAPILEMRRNIANSLEDVFLELTGENETSSDEKTDEEALAEEVPAEEKEEGEKDDESNL